MLFTSNLDRTTIYYVLVMIYMRWWMDSFVLTVAFKLMHNQCNFTGGGWCHSSWSYQRNWSYLMILYVMDVNLEIRMSLNNSCIASWYSTISSSIHDWLQTGTTWFCHATCCMFTVFTIGLVILKSFFLVINRFTLSRCRYEFKNFSWVDSVCRGRVY